MHVATAALNLAIQLTLIIIIIIIIMNVVVPSLSTAVRPIVHYRV